MSFVNHDLQPLPKIIREPSTSNMIHVAGHCLDTLKVNPTCSVFGLEEMTFRARLTISEALALRQPISDITITHNHLLLNIYARLTMEHTSGLSLSKISPKALDELPGPPTPGLTSRALFLNSRKDRIEDI
ncbi:hypothetical protein AOQ84DRAFT_380158 [Glonium stellatum]|uniref:Uncharacterized protein n=1 Tax=Glonium stellatum TaxID=574774 RepID=A0A8E2EU18_9PEZI|nr:hypothetical protein AOQ84DRAFT_380158 [Glonium stellatum]